MVIKVAIQHNIIVVSNQAIKNVSKYQFNAN